MANTQRVDFDRGKRLCLGLQIHPERGPAMDSPVQERYYRCYFISNDHVVGYENVFSHDDAGAIEKLRRVLAATEHLFVELWRGKKCVSKLDKIQTTLEQKSAS